jgi:hypothetical protein
MLLYVLQEGKLLYIFGYPGCDLLASLTSACNNECRRTFCFSSLLLFIIRRFAPPLTICVRMQVIHNCDVPIRPPPSSSLIFRVNNETCVAD